MSIQHVPNSRLFFAGNMVEAVVPEYELTQSNPLLAAKTGIGNCVAKAAIAAVILEHSNFLNGTQPSLAWNRGTHPLRRHDMRGRVKLLNGHAWLLATTNEPNKITYLSFNEERKKANEWKLDDFNSIGEYAAAQDGLIVATPLGEEKGYVIEEWHEGGKQYYEALGMENSPYHSVSKVDMSQQIINHMRKRELLIQITA